MNYSRIFFILGLLIALVPFFGIPLLWKHIVTVALGSGVIALAIMLRLSLSGFQKRSAPQQSHYDLPPDQAVSFSDNEKTMQSDVNESVINTEHASVSEAADAHEAS